MWTAKDVYYISDGTGILATNVGQALLCQFPGTSFHEEKFPFISTAEDAKKTLAYIIKQSGGRRPILFCTIIHTEIRKIFDIPEVEFFDALGNLLDRLEECIETKSLREPGYVRHHNDMAMTRRVEAIHYCLEHDDGTKVDGYDQADVILLGVSRTGKTPVSVYMATQMGLKSANFPFTSETLQQYRLPPTIRSNSDRVVGLTTTGELLHSAREKRYPGSNYAKLSTCREEIQMAQHLLTKYHIPVVSTAGKAIEEIAIQVMQELGISKKNILR